MEEFLLLFLFLLISEPNSFFFTVLKSKKIKEIEDRDDEEEDGVEDDDDDFQFNFFQFVFVLIYEIFKLFFKIKNRCFNDIFMSFSKLALPRRCSFAISAVFEGKIGGSTKTAKKMIV